LRQVRDIRTRELVPEYQGLERPRPEESVEPETPKRRTVLAKIPFFKPS
jgi:hypothetical protein